MIYVLFIRRYGVRSWIPWFISLAMDLGGMGILTQVTTKGDNGQTRKHHLSPSENDEVILCFTNLPCTFICFGIY